MYIIVMQNPQTCRIHISRELVRNIESQGTWVVQSVKCLASAQVMISQFVSSSSASGSVLTARNLEPASDSVSPSPPHTVSLPLPHLCSVSLCLSKINVKKIFFKKYRISGVGLVG